MRVIRNLRNVFDRDEHWWYFLSQPYQILAIFQMMSLRRYRAHKPTRVSCSHCHTVWYCVKMTILYFSVCHHNQNDGLPCCSTQRYFFLFLYFELIQTSSHEGDMWYHFVVIFTCLLSIMYFVCNSMAINLIWVDLDCIEKSLDSKTINFLTFFGWWSWPSSEIRLHQNKS